MIMTLQRRLDSDQVPGLYDTYELGRLDEDHPRGDPSSVSVCACVCAGESYQYDSVVYNSEMFTGSPHTRRQRVRTNVQFCAPWPAHNAVAFALLAYHVSELALALVSTTDRVHG